MTTESTPTPALALIFKYTDDDLRAHQKSISDEYTRLFKSCQNAGLSITGKRGERGTLVVFVDANEAKAKSLISWEHALTSTSHVASPTDTITPTPSLTLRALYTYLTTPISQGGLDILPQSFVFPHLQQIVAPHLANFKAGWLDRLKSPSLGNIGYDDDQIQQMGVLYGPATAIYFASLTLYARALVIPAVIGIGLHFESPAFVQHPLYSLALLAWAIVFVELWRNKSSGLAAKFTSSPTSAISPLAISTSTKETSSWYITEAKTALTIPLLLASVGFVSFNMTVAFMLEAFVARLYNGPLKFLAPLLPTVYNILTTPPFVAVYGIIAHALVNWEGHSTKRARDASLLIKLLPINGMVAFYALVLSAGVYAPFGEELMSFFHITLFHHENETVNPDAWFRSPGTPPTTMPHTRLGEQMFSFTLVLQLFPLIAEIVAPFAIRFALRFVKEWREGKKVEKSTSTVEVGSERKLIDNVLFEAGLPEHDFFNDYLTLVLQFGYLVMWSTAYPLTPAILLFLALIRLRTDALKILVHFKRAIPSRGATDAAGVWTTALSCISWVGALVNAFLLLVVAPLVHSHVSATAPPPSNSAPLHHHHGRRPHRFDVPSLAQKAKEAHQHYSTHGASSLVVQNANALRSHIGSLYTSSPSTSFTTGSIMSESTLYSPMGVAAIVLFASWGFIAASWYAGHIVDSISRDKAKKDVGEPKDVALANAQDASAGGMTEDRTSSETGVGGFSAASEAFWGEDEGESEIWKKVV